MNMDLIFWYFLGLIIFDIITVSIAIHQYLKQIEKLYKR